MSQGINSRLAGVVEASLGELFLQLRLLPAMRSLAWLAYAECLWEECMLGC